MREKLRKHGREILSVALSLIIAAFGWLIRDLDRIGALKEVAFDLELIQWVGAVLIVWSGELVPWEEPDYGPEINRRNRKIDHAMQIGATVLFTAIFIVQLVTGEMFLWRLF